MDHTGDTEHAASPGSPLLSTKDSEKLYGMIEEGEGSQTSSELSSQKKNTPVNPMASCGCCFCTTFSIAIILLLILALIGGFATLTFIPYPSTNNVQQVLLGDTVPIYFTDIGDIPNSFNTYWYKSVSIRLNNNPDLNVPVNFTFVRGGDACIPLSSRKKTEVQNEIDVDLSSERNVSSTQYFTRDSEVSINITRTDDDNSTALVDFILSCNGVKDNVNRSLSLAPSSNEKGTLVVPFSSYCKVYLQLNSDSPVRSLTVDYDYQATYSYYNISDYDSGYSFYQHCAIGPDTSSNDHCDFKLSQRNGCLFASSVVPENEAEFVELNVHVEHERFTVPSVVCLTFAGAFFILFVFCVMAYVWQVCRPKRKY